jgi:uncharacterized protein involved in outer membrane biogenesis
MRAIRYGLIAVAGVLTSVACLFAAVTLWLNSANTRALIEQRASNALGREMRFGNVELVGLAPPTIGLHDLRIANAPWAGDRPFLEATRIAFAVDMASLLAGQVKVRRVTLAEASARIARNQAGQGNWPAAGGEGGDGPLPLIGAHDLQIQYTAANRKQPIKVHLTRVAVQGTRETARLRLHQPADSDGLVLTASRNINKALAPGQAPTPVRVEVAQPGGRIAYNGTLAMQPARLDGELAVSLERPKRFFTALGLNAPAAVPPMDWTAAVSLQQRQARVQIESGQIDGHRLDATARLTRPDGRRRLESDIQLGSWPLPLARLCAREPEDRQDDPLRNPLDVLPAWPVVVTLQVDRLVCEGVPAGRMAVQLRWNGERLYYDLRELAVVGGRLSGDGQLSPTPDRTTALTLNGEAHGLELASITAIAGLGQGTPVAGGLSGQFDVELVLQRPVQTLGGQIVAVVHDGQLPQRLIERSTLDIGSITVEGGGEPVDMRCAITDLRLDSGRARIKTFVLLTPSATVVADGRIDFARTRLQLSLQANAENVGFFDLSAPIRIKGPFASPSLSIDAAHAVVEGGGKALLAFVAPPATALLTAFSQATNDQPECSRITEGRQEEAS